MTNSLNDYANITSTYCSSFETVYSFSWSAFEVNIEFKPILHQKRINDKQSTMYKSRKGIGFVKQFKGHKYSIGKKK